MPSYWYKNQFHQSKANNSIRDLLNKKNKDKIEYRVKEDYKNYNYRIIFWVPKITINRNKLNAIKRKNKIL